MTSFAPVATNSFEVIQNRATSEISNIKFYIKASFYVVRKLLQGYSSSFILCFCVYFIS